MSEDREMLLGYSGANLQQLDSYQRHVIGERIYGYCLAPLPENCLVGTWSFGYPFPGLGEERTA